MGGGGGYGLTRSGLASSIDQPPPLPQAIRDSEGMVSSPPRTARASRAAPQAGWRRPRQAARQRAATSHQPPRSQPPSLTTPFPAMHRARPGCLHLRAAVSAPIVLKSTPVSMGNRFRSPK